MNDEPVTEQVPVFVPSTNRKLKFNGEQAYEYEVFKVVDEYDSILNKKAIAWDFSNPPADLKYIGISMLFTMAKQGGVGLAANQCGLRYNIFVMGAGSYGEVIVNPEILEKQGEEIDNEGCLSFPGLFLKIKRATKVKVRYYDMNGIVQEKEFDGLSARVFQHEYDHLQGIKYTSLVSRISVDKAKEKVKVNLKRMKQARITSEKQHKLEQLKTQQQKPSNPTISLNTQENKPVESLQTFKLDTPDITITD